ncbi:hypothetical protein GCM10027269_33640 [Kribbella endophytica]
MAGMISPAVAIDRDVPMKSSPYGSHLRKVCCRRSMSVSTRLVSYSHRNQRAATAVRTTAHAARTPRCDQSGHCPVDA